MKAGTESRRAEFEKPSLVHRKFLVFVFNRERAGDLSRMKSIQMFEVTRDTYALKFSISVEFDDP